MFAIEQMHRTLIIYVFKYIALFQVLAIITGKWAPMLRSKNSNETSLEDESEALRKQPLRTGVSTRALFDLEEEHKVFVEVGVHAYANLQREREDCPIAKGAGFEVIRRFLSLNENEKRPYVEVVILS